MQLMSKARSLFNCLGNEFGILILRLLFSFYFQGEFPFPINKISSHSFLNRTSYTFNTSLINTS